MSEPFLLRPIRHVARFIGSSLIQDFETPFKISGGMSSALVLRDTSIKRNGL